MVITINTFGSVKKGYVAVEELLSTTNLGYNLVYRILSPTVFITVISIIFYAIGLSSLLRNIWLIVIYYFIYQTISLLLLKRFALVNKFLYLIIVLLSILLAYQVYISTLQYGLSAILPESSGFKTEIWILIFAYLYGVLNEYVPGASENKRMERFLISRYEKLSEIYNSKLTKEFKENAFLRWVFYSIMITEDINRPPFVRLLERVLFFTKRVSTSGIMQVKSNRPLSDLESIKLAQKIILDSFRKHSKEGNSDFGLFFSIASDYNGGEYSRDLINNNYVIKNIIYRDLKTV